MTGTLWPMMMPLADADDDGICVVRTSGHRITFADGNTVLCGTSGLWNANLGYGNQAISAAVADALGSLSYAGVFRYENAPARTAAERLIAASAHDWARVIFSVSGGTANDLTMKLARQYHELGGDPARKLVVGLKDGYHGLTFGAHALTGEDLGQRAYGVDTRLVRHVPANDETALKALFAAFGRQIAAIVVEPVLGNGAVVLEAGYVEQLRPVRGRDRGPAGRRRGGDGLRPDRRDVRLRRLDPAAGCADRLQGPHQRHHARLRAADPRPGRRPVP